jgi:protein-disulfide isomerase
MKRYLPLLLIAAIAVAGIAGASVLLRSKQTSTTAPLFTGQNVLIKATPTPNTTGTAPRTLANVSVTVEEFGDYQCPPCGMLHPEMKKIQAEYGPRVRFVFHNFPLTKMHKNALAAAQAAEAARLQTKFWEMHDLLYENQKDWKDAENPRPMFAKYARELGLDVMRFERDMESSEVQHQIDADMQLGNSAEVVGTPTILIEGRQLKPEVTNPEGIRKGIDLMLARKAGKQ